MLVRLPRAPIDNTPSVACTITGPTVRYCRCEYG